MHTRLLVICSGLLTVAPKTATTSSFLWFAEVPFDRLLPMLDTFIFLFPIITIWRDIILASPSVLLLVSFKTPTLPGPLLYPASVGLPVEIFVAYS